MGDNCYLLPFLCVEYKPTSLTFYFLNESSNILFDSFYTRFYFIIGFRFNFEDLTGLDLEDLTGLDLGSSSVGLKRINLSPTR